MSASASRIALVGGQSSSGLVWEVPTHVEIMGFGWPDSAADSDWQVNPVACRRIACLGGCRLPAPTGMGSKKSR